MFEDHEPGQTTDHAERAEGTATSVLVTILVVALLALGVYFYRHHVAGGGAAQRDAPPRVTESSRP